MTVSPRPPRPPPSALTVEPRPRASRVFAIARRCHRGPRHRRAALRRRAGRCRICSSSSPCWRSRRCWNLLAGYAGLVSVGPAGLRRLRRLRDVRARLSSAASIRCSRSPLGGLAAALLAMPTAFFIFRLAAPTSPSAPGSSPRWCASGRASGRRSAAAPAPRCPAGDARHAGVDQIRRRFGVSGAAARDILTYWLALGLAAPPSASSTG